MSIINSAVDSEMKNFIFDLQELIREPSISIEKQGLVECANKVQQLMRKAGINSEMLYLDSKKKEDVPPIIYGEIKSKSNPNGKTILFYNHYDVQPVEPLDQWEKDPFSGEVDHKYIFGRGSADDKGEIITRIKAIEYFLKLTGDVPCNIKFLIEGEEEVGSTHLQEYLTLYQQKVSGSDVVIWESALIDEKNRPIIELGVKGIISVELIVKGPSVDTHSSLAAIVENPAWTLVRALNTLCDSNQQILIKNWYDEVKDFTPAELTALANEPFDELEFKKEYGLNNFINNLDNVEELNTALAGKPTCNIAGLKSGYTSKGIKNIIPASALAKLDLRLVPDMTPRKQFERLKNHLNNNGFYNIELKLIDQVAPARTPVDHPLVKIIVESAKDVFGTAIISVSSAGTGPMSYFDSILGVPSICVGGPYKFSRAHGPNEFARIDDLNKTTKCIGRIIEKFGK